MIELLIVEFSALISAPYMYFFFPAIMSWWKNTSKGNSFVFKSQTINYTEKFLGADFLANNAHKSLLQNVMF